jgi:hypothetical protein
LPFVSLFFVIYSIDCCLWCNVCDVFLFLNHSSLNFSKLSAHIQSQLICGAHMILRDRAVCSVIQTVISKNIRSVPPLVRTKFLYRIGNRMLSTYSASLCLHFWRPVTLSFFTGNMSCHR